MTTCRGGAVKQRSCCYNNGYIVGLCVGQVHLRGGWDRCLCHMSGYIQEVDEVTGTATEQKLCSHDEFGKNLKL